MLRQSDTNYIVCNSGYTSRIADRPIKKGEDYDEEGDIEFIHYTYQELVDIKNGDLSKIKKNQGKNKNYERFKKK